MKTKIWISLGIIVIGAAIVIVKILFFPSIKNDYFASDPRNLRRVPAGLAVFRPTYFSFLQSKGVIYMPPTSAKANDWRMMDRNAPLSEVIAAAYNVEIGHVEMPFDAPTNHYDFLITTSGHQRERLRELIHKQLGLVGKKEKGETDILALKVVDPKSPGLKPSGDDEKSNVRFNDLSLHFTHVPVAAISDGLGHYLPQPVVNKTGLTNFYDFDIAYDTETRKALQNPATARATLDQILSRLGLGLVPDIASVEMLVVKKEIR